MKSRYLLSAEDLNVGDTVLVDGDPEPVRIIGLGEIFATCEAANGYQWSVMRNRLTSAASEPSAEGEKK